MSLPIEPSPGVEVKDLMPDGELFSEDRHTEIVMAKIEKDRSGKFSKWLSSFLRWSEPKPFNPKMLSDDAYVQRGDQIQQEAMTLLAADGWKKEKDGPRPGDVVETLSTAKYGKVFRLTGTVDCPAEFLFRELCQNVEEIPKWNPTILESKIIRTINSDTDISYQVTAGGGGGAVKPRDFVNVRRTCRVGQRFMSCGSSVEYPGHPPTSAFIRGDNLVGIWIMQDIPGSNSKQCTFQWLMSCDLKGWIPQYVLDIAFTTAMLDFLGHLSAFAEKKKAEGLF